MKYVVTGAAGFIGSHLADALEEEGHDVVRVDCFTPYYDVELKRDNVGGRDVVEADLAGDPLDELVRGCDGIFHLAGQPGVRSFGPAFPDYVRHNVLASQRLFEAAATAGARVVLASSSSVYGDAERYPTPEDLEPRPISPYGITKLAAEHLARAYGRSFGLDCVTLRYFTVYGPRQRPDMAFARLLAALASDADFELYGDGSISRSFTFVADVVAATAAAMEHGRRGALYNVGGGSEATMAEAIATAERVADRPLNLRRLPETPGDVRRTAPDSTRIRRDLGWEPQVSLEDGLRAQWEWASARVAAR